MLIFRLQQFCFFVTQSSHLFIKAGKQIILGKFIHKRRQLLLMSWKSDSSYWSIKRQIINIFYDLDDISSPSCVCECKFGLGSFTTTWSHRAHVCIQQWALPRWLVYSTFTRGRSHSSAHRSVPLSFFSCNSITVDW